MIVIDPRRSLVADLRKIHVDLKEAWPRIQTEIHNLSSKDGGAATCFQSRLNICFSNLDDRTNPEWIEYLVADTILRLKELCGYWKLEQYKALLFTGHGCQLLLTPETTPLAFAGIEIKYAMAAMEIAIAHAEGCSKTVSAMLSRLLPGACDNAIKFCEQLIEVLESSPF